MVASFRFYTCIYFEFGSSVITSSWRDDSDLLTFLKKNLIFPCISILYLKHQFQRSLCVIFFTNNHSQLFQINGTDMLCRPANCVGPAC
jgi:hypothetical protein